MGGLVATFAFAQFVNYKGLTLQLDDLAQPTRRFCEGVRLSVRILLLPGRKAPAGWGDPATGDSSGSPPRGDKLMKPSSRRNAAERVDSSTSSSADMAESQAEFVRLFSQHASQLFGFVLVLTGNRADADDVFQNSSVVLWEKFETYRSGSSFLAWARRIAYLETLAARRKTARMQTLSEDAWQVLAEDALAVVDEAPDRQWALGECMEKLVASDRRLLEQKYFSQLSVAEIATTSSKGGSSVYRALSRIHHQLLQCVERALSTH